MQSAIDAVLQQVGRPASGARLYLPTVEEISISMLTQISSGKQYFCELRGPPSHPRALSLVGHCRRLKLRGGLHALVHRRDWNVCGTILHTIQSITLACLAFPRSPRDPATLIHHHHQRRHRFVRHSYADHSVSHGNLGGARRLRPLGARLTGQNCADANPARAGPSSIDQLDSHQKVHPSGSQAPLWRSTMYLLGPGRLRVPCRQGRAGMQALCHGLFRDCLTFPADDHHSCLACRSYLGVANLRPPTPTHSLMSPPCPPFIFAHTLTHTTHKDTHATA